MFGVPNFVHVKKALFFTQHLYLEIRSLWKFSPSYILSMIMILYDDMVIFIQSNMVYNLNYPIILIVHIIVVSPLRIYTISRFSLYSRYHVNHRFMTNNLFKDMYKA